MFRGVRGDLAFLDIQYAISCSHKRLCCLMWVIFPHVLGRELVFISLGYVYPMFMSAELVLAYQSILTLTDRYPKQQRSCVELAAGDGPPVLIYAYLHDSFLL